MTAAERAKRMHWDVTPTPIAKRDQAGEVIGAEIAAWNEQARKQSIAEREGAKRLLRELGKW